MVGEEMISRMYGLGKISPFVLPMYERRIKCRRKGLREKALKLEYRAVHNERISKLLDIRI